MKIKTVREQRGFTMAQLADMVGINKSTIKRYEDGTINRPSLPSIQSIAIALNVNPAWLVGKSDDITTDLPDNIIPMPHMSSVLLVGTIACGDPLLAEENIEEYIEMPEHFRADFALRCRGDSMIGARIHDGDIVYIKQDAFVNNGDIAAVLIGDEATLKRVYRNENSIVFQPENPSYAPLVFYGEDMEDIRILGKAVAFTSVIK